MNSPCGLTGQQRTTGYQSLPPSRKWTGLAAGRKPVTWLSRGVEPSPPPVSSVDLSLEVSTLGLAPSTQSSLWVQPLSLSVSSAGGSRRVQCSSGGAFGHQHGMGGNGLVVQAGPPTTCGPTLLPPLSRSSLPTPGGEALQAGPAIPSCLLS